MLSRKTYIKLAGLIKDSRSSSNPHRLLIEGIINFLKEDNPRFDEERFRKASV